MRSAVTVVSSLKSRPNQKVEQYCPKSKKEKQFEIEAAAREQLVVQQKARRKVLDKEKAEKAIADRKKAAAENKKEGRTRHISHGSPEWLQLIHCRAEDKERVLQLLYEEGFHAPWA